MGYHVWPTGRTCDLISGLLTWHAAKPRTPRRDVVGLTQSEFFFVVLRIYFFISLFGSSFEPFGPTFRTSSMDDYWKPLVRTSGSWTSKFFTILLRITSWWTPLIHSYLWFCMTGIQFPMDHFVDPFQSSVISMVAPTWCDGPIWGNPSWENLDRLDNRIYTFNLVIRLRMLEQSAFFQVSLRRRRVLNSWPWYVASFFLYMRSWQPCKPPFLTLLKRLAAVFFLPQHSDVSHLSWASSTVALHEH